MCHGSVGLVARAFEAAGIPTVCVAVRAFQHRMETVGVPRTLVTPHLMGRTVGPVGDRERQRRVVAAALELLETATEPGTLVLFDHEETSPHGPAV